MCLYVLNQVNKFEKGGISKLSMGGSVSLNLSKYTVFMFPVNVSMPHGDGENTNANGKNKRNI